MGKYQGTKQIFYISIFLVLLASCSNYEKVLKSDDYIFKYNKALEYYNAEDYARANTLFEQITPVFNGTNKADTVNFYYAMSSYHLNDYIVASHHFKTFSQVFGNSPFASQAEYMHAYCFYLLSPRPSLDQDYSVKAIQAFRLYLIRNPNGKFATESQEKIKELEDKLVEKSYLNARLYFDLGDYKASIIALNNGLNEYPNTKHREELMFLILKSRFLLASNSIETKQMERYQATLDEYYSFIAEFPDSQYQKEVERIYESTANVLDINIANIN